MFSSEAGVFFSKKDPSGVNSKVGVFFFFKDPPGITRRFYAHFSKKINGGELKEGGGGSQRILRYVLELELLYYNII